MALINSVTFSLLKILRNLVSMRNMIHNTFSPYKRQPGLSSHNDIAHNPKTAWHHFEFLLIPILHTLFSLILRY